MATAVQKIRLSSSRDIPFDKLVLSQANVRRVKAGVSVEELAESIARRGLIQSLHVRPVLDADGKETGTYEVPAGGRRFRALELLVKQKRLARTAPVPCVVSEAGSEVLIDEVSLAENIERAPLHPLDQFRAFQALREKGMTEEAIAAAFFVGAQVVKQRLRLAAVSPILLDVYAEDGMTLEQLMAFTVSADHERQERVWQTLGSGWSKEPWQIRRMLTETTVRASDRRAVFVGVEAYEAAGGVVLRDLFQSDDGGWLQDAGLLDRLVAEKLTAAAEAVAAEGWKWVEAAVSLPYGATFELRTLDGVPIEMTEADYLQMINGDLNGALRSFPSMSEGGGILVIGEVRDELRPVRTAHELEPIQPGLDVRLRIALVAVRPPALAGDHVHQAVAIDVGHAIRRQQLPPAPRPACLWSVGGATRNVARRRTAPRRHPGRSGHAAPDLVVHAVLSRGHGHPDPQHDRRRDDRLPRGQRDL